MGSAPFSAMRSDDRSSSTVVARELPPQHGVREVRRGRDGAAVLGDQLGPQDGPAEEIQRGDRDQVQPERHRHGEEADHPHVVEERQPRHLHVAVDVEARRLRHRRDVGVQVAVRDPHGLRLGRGSAGELQQRGVALVRDGGVGCTAARSPSSASIVRNGMPRSVRTGASASNGGPSTTSAASIILRTETVSSAQAARSVRAVGWCSIVTLPPQSHTAWASGAICTGSPASTPRPSRG
jgi:hypothetical protein